MAVTDKSKKAPSSDEPASEPSTQTRLSVNINRSTATALTAFAKEHGISLTEAVRRLVSIGSAIALANQGGKQILLKDGDQIERLILLS